MGNYYEPFESAEEVWFWFCSSVAAREDGWRSRGDYGGGERCCEANDIYRIIKKMRANCHITNRHLRVMFRWGNAMISPYYDKHAKKSEVRLWEEGMTNLGLYLKQKGII